MTLRRKRMTIPKANKPHVYRIYSPTSLNADSDGWIWVCETVSRIHPGSGKTPAEAFRSWRRVKKTMGIAAARSKRELRRYSDISNSTPYEPVSSQGSMTVFERIFGGWR